MSSAKRFGIVEHLQRVLNAEERKVLVVARQLSERKPDAVAPVCLGQETLAATRPASSIWAVKHWRLALVMAGCALLVLSTLRCPLAAQDSAPPPQPDHVQLASSPDEHERIMLPAGTVISVRIADRVDSNKLHSGDLLTGIVDPSVIYNDRVLIPRGTEAHVRMAENKKGGHLRGKAEVELELIGLVMNGRKARSGQRYLPEGARRSSGKGESRRASERRSWGGRGDGFGPRCGSESSNCHISCRQGGYPSKHPGRVHPDSSVYFF